MRFAGCGGWLGQIHSREDVGEEQVALAVACKRPISLTEPTVGQEPALWTGKLEGRARYARQGSPIPAYPLPECWSKQWGRPSARTATELTASPRDTPYSTCTTKSKNCASARYEPGTVSKALEQPTLLSEITCAVRARNSEQSGERSSRGCTACERHSRSFDLREILCLPANLC